MKDKKNSRVLLMLQQRENRWKHEIQELNTLLKNAEKRKKEAAANLILHIGLQILFTVISTFTIRFLYLGGALTLYSLVVAYVLKYGVFIALGILIMNEIYIVLHAFVDSNHIPIKRLRDYGIYEEKIRYEQLIIKYKGYLNKIVTIYENVKFTGKLGDLNDNHFNGYGMVGEELDFEEIQDASKANDPEVMYRKAFRFVQNMRTEPEIPVSHVSISKQYTSFKIIIIIIILSVLELPFLLQQ